MKASKSGLLASLDDLAALRDQVDLDKFAKDQPKTTDPGDVSVVTRNIITSKAGGTSGGISAPTSSGLAAGSGSLRGIYTTQVKDPNLGASGQAATRAGGSGKASRSADEIALVFTKNKGAIDAMYARALRDNPGIAGQGRARTDHRPVRRHHGGAHRLLATSTTRNSRANCWRASACSNSTPRMSRL